MNLFSWNCRGLGLPRTVQELVALVRAKSPMLVFLSETRMKGSRVANLRWRLGLKHCITVDSVGTGGGLALFWHESVDVSDRKTPEIYRCSCQGKPFGGQDAHHVCIW